MKNLLLLLLLCLSLNGMSQSLKIAQTITKLDGKYKIKYRECYYDVDTTAVTVKLKDLKVPYKGFRMLRQNKLGYMDLQKPDNMSFDDFVVSLTQDEIVESVIYCSFGEYTACPPGSTFPNDSDLSEQWYLDAINVCDAWEITTGNPSIIVAILDNGVDWTHPDLGLGSDSYQNIYLNPGEDPWIDPNNPQSGNGIDDDGNGFVDDWKGWDFTGICYYSNSCNDSRGLVGYFPFPEVHGTLVAGIIGAKTHNNLGIAGIAGGRNDEGVKLLSYFIGGMQPIKSALIDAILAAVDNGAKVIQLSCHIAQSQDIDDAIQYAISNNVVIVCAAGSIEAPYTTNTYVRYPASHPNVISVGAVDQNLVRAAFSPYGSDLDIVAPGVEIYTTFSAHRYIVEEGTSLAAPIVSGVAALMLSVNPELIPEQVREYIAEAAQKVGGNPYYYSGQYGTWDNQYGYGMINAFAVQNVCDDIQKYYNLAGQPVISDRTIYGCRRLEVQNVTVSNNATLTLDALGNIDIQNVTVTNGATLILKADGDINVREVYVDNNSKLIFNAAGEVTIERDFEVESGSDFEIRK